MKFAQVFASTLIGLIAVALVACCALGFFRSGHWVQILLALPALACIILLVAKVRLRLAHLEKRRAALLASAIRTGLL